MTRRFQTTSSLKRKLRRSLVAHGFFAFRRKDGGVLALPLIMFLLAMLAIGGIGVDLVRHERDRTIMQYTLDRAVLAAADLDQPLEPKAVVEDYLTKAGLGEYYDENNVTPKVTPTSRSVSANINAEFSPYWLRFAGVETDLPLKAASTAIESIGNVEISLVLDVSASMRNNSRLVNLKTAAKEFIQTMHDNTEEGNLSISIVPYSTQVSMPEAFLTQLSVDTDNQHSFCLNFDGSDYSATSLSLTKNYERTMHFSPWGAADYRASGGLSDQAVCAAHSTDPNRTAMLLEDDVDKLQDYIDNFSDAENTSIDIGMKWGVALLDPSVQPMIDSMTQGESPEINARFSNRPVAYSDHETLKVVVLMTDGQNTDQAYVNAAHRTGDSGVWYNAQEQVYSTLDDKGTSRTDDDEYYLHNIDAWSDAPYGNRNGIYSQYVCTSETRRGKCKTGYHRDEEIDDPGEAVALSFAELFARTDLQYLYYSLFSEWMNYYTALDTWYYDVFDVIGPSLKDTRTRSICQAAKDEGIVVFTIGFEAPLSGQQVLSDCATSTNHYYDVEGLEIKDAFTSIASAIRQLRLTE